MGNSRGRSTAQRILDVAERLFAEGGYNDTTMREVVKVAEVNIAAIGYHFGSKDGLLRALVARATAPVNAERERRVRALVHRPDRPTVEDVVRAFVEPALRLSRSDREKSRLVGGVVFATSPRVRQIIAAETNSIRDHCLAALCRAMPDLDPSALLFGYAVMVGQLAQHQAGLSAQLHERADLLDGTPPVSDEEYLIRFIVAGFAHGLSGSATSRPDAAHAP